MSDPVGPADAPLDGGAIDFIAEHVAARADELETDGVPRQLLIDLGRNSLFGTPHAQQRELTEVLAGSSADTWFCWAQHATPLRTLESAQGEAADALRGQWFAKLASGQAIAAVAFAHLRRRGAANPHVEPVAGGWVLRGTLDWITSWDIADVLVLMARYDDEIVQFLIPIAGGAPEGLNVGPVLDLVAMRGTHTRSATLQDMFLPETTLLDRIPFEDWQQTDAVKTAEVNPAVFGIIRSAVAELDELAKERDDALLHTLVAVLADECRVLRNQAYTGESSVGLRAQALDLAMRASTAVVTARAGSAMQAGSSAERRVRAALFMQVQAQTLASRNAALDLLVSESENHVELMRQPHGN